MSGYFSMGLIAVAWLVTLLSSITVCALQDASWHALKEYARRKRRKYRFDQIYEDYEEVLVAGESLRMLGAMGMLAGIFVLGDGWTGNATGETVRAMPVWAVVVFGGLVLIATTVWVPRTISQLFGTEYLYHTWVPVHWVGWMLSPLSVGLLASSMLARRLEGNNDPATEEEAFEDEIRAIVEEGQNDGFLEADTRDMIEGVIELDDANVADVMTPRSEMDIVSVDLDWPELLAFVASAGRTRVPVYESTPDNIVGILYVKDLLTELAQSDVAARKPLRQIIRKPIHVPKTTRLDELLQRFLAERQHLFVVVDEYMNLAGLVTIEDVLEEIVGEILDESDDDEESEIQIVDGSSAIVLGRAHVETVNDQLGIELPLDQDYDTLGGFILRQLERIPTVGESVVWNGIHMEVIAATPRRVERVKVHVLAEKSAVPAEPRDA